MNMYYTKTGIFLLSVFLFTGMLSVKQSKAQYFGQNKMQYEDFHFQILKTKHFDVYYYPEAEQAAKIAAKLAERWYTRHSKVFGFELSGRQPLILYASHPQFQQTNTISGDIGEGVGGVTEPLKRRIVIPLAGPLAETDHVIGHELVHAFQYDSTGHRGGEQAFRNPAIESMPLWFVEGMAEYLSIGYKDPNTAMWMRDAVKNLKELPSISKLSDPEYFPYRYGQSLMAYIGGRWGDDKIGKLLLDSGSKGNIDRAVKRELGIGIDTLSQDWHADLYGSYYGFTKMKKMSSDYGTELISDSTGSGKYNVGPVLSPDGHNLVFFSEKDLFSIDLFLANAQNGKIEKNILETAFDPHFESLQFINSAGAWSPSGDRVAFGIITKGRPALSILDVAKDKEVREIPFKNIGEILNPTWSPDGRYIMFSAIVGGLSDLFMYDLQQNNLIRITDDAYADIQPAWSPDGKTVAFITDRFTTNLNDLDIGEYRLALYNVETKAIEPVNGFNKGKHSSPQWSEDGKQLYFISDQSGISNIYRLDLKSDQIYQLTDLYTGVSGITSMSPAISVASKADRMVYSVYENSSYEIYAIDSLASRPGILVSNTVKEVEPYTIVDNNVLQTDPAILPPARRVDNEITSLLDNPELGLNNADSLKYLPYKSKFTLDYVGQPYLAAGIDQYGAQLGGGISLYWSDMLGNNSLITMAQVQYDAGLTDFAGALGYQNSSHRLNWGAVLQQIPYTLNQYAGFYAINSDSTLVYVDQQYRTQQLNRTLNGFMSYPFSRTMRMEFSSGISYISFDQRIRTWITRYSDGQLLSKSTDKLPVPKALTLGNFSAAFVYDNSIYGATSPIAGQRSRVEISPTVGSLSMYSILADYRHYFLPIRPLTLAFRLMHYGRYGGGAEDSRLTPLYIGYQDFVRGYDSNSFNSSETAVFDRLLGSKMAVMNWELRFPLLGLFRLGHGYYGYLPLETGFFYDSGVTWSNGSKPQLIGGDRKAVRSYGLLSRFNLFGAAILELDYVNPVDRPNQGWYWQFNLTSGF
jgi:Tol biopolymer transport system component